MITRILVILFFLSPAINNAQIYGDSIKTVKERGGIYYYHNSKNLSYSDLKNLSYRCTGCTAYIREGFTANYLGLSLRVAGGLSLGWAFTNLVVLNKDPNMIFVAGGAILIGMSIPFIFISREKYQKGVDLYNEQLRISIQKKSSMQLNFGMNQYGVGFQLKF